MTDINKIINGCDYGSKIRADSLDTYQKNELIQSIIYTADGDDVCLDMQTAQNLNSNIESKGSSYKYTLDAQSFYNKIQNNQENFIIEINKNQKINKTNSNSNILIFMIIIILFVYLVNILHS